MDSIPLSLGQMGLTAFMPSVNTSLPKAELSSMQLTQGTEGGRSLSSCQNSALQTPGELSVSRILEIRASTFYFLPQGLVQCLALTDIAKCLEMLG